MIITYLLALSACQILNLNLSFLETCLFAESKFRLQFTLLISENGSQKITKKTTYYFFYCRTTFAYTHKKCMHCQKTSSQIIICSWKNIKCKKILQIESELWNFRHTSLCFTYLHFLMKFQTGISQVRLIVKSPSSAQITGLGKNFHLS